MAGWDKAEGVGKEGFHDCAQEPVLVGKIMGIEHNAGTKKNSTIYTIIKKDKSEIKFWGSTVLDDLMSDYVVGDVIKVVFMGWGGQGSNKYKKFEAFKWNPNAMPQAQPVAGPLLTPEQAAANTGSLPPDDDIPDEEVDPNEITLDDIPF